MINSRRQLVKLALAGAVVGVAAATASRKKLAHATADATTRVIVDNDACNNLLSHALRPLMGSQNTVLCDKYANKVLLIVNTASKCGFTPQFEQLEALNQRYSEKGFQVLGFPSGDFRQELDTEEEVARFCELNYGVTFPMFEKIHVTGDKAHPLFQQLAQTTGSYPNWNFNKYLVNRDGEAIKHYGSGTEPLSNELVDDIEALL